MKRFISLFIACLVLAGCNDTSVSTTPTTHQPSIDFTEASENQKNMVFSIDSSSGIDLSVYDTDMSDYMYMGDDAIHFKGLTFAEALKIYDSSFTGLIAYGYPTCSFCNRAFPVLSDVLNVNNVDTYYVNVHLEGYSPTSEDLDEFKSYAYEYYQEDSNGEKSFFVPTIFAVVNGQIVGAHTGILEDVSVDVSQELSAENYQALFDIYQGLVDLVVE